MTEALIVNGVVIANGVADSDGDVLDKKDIKTIFMKYTRDTDTMHTNIRNAGVEVFASWISEVDTSIGGRVAPAGSWLATLKVTNEKLIQCINEGKLKGFSLGSVSDKAFTPQYWFINKSLNYRDIKDIEEVIPLFISFVDIPANQYDFEVMTYDAYINKNQKDVEEMTEDNTTEMITAPVSFFDKVFDALGIQKSEEVIEKADEEPVVEPTESADDKVQLLFDKLDTIIEQNNQILEGISKAEEEEEKVEEEEIEKAEEEKEEDESSEEKEEEKDEEIEKEESSEEKEEEDEDDVHVEKRETNMIEKQVTERNTTFYQNTGRDHLGRKIRK